MAEKENIFRIAIDTTKAQFIPPNGEANSVTCAAIRRRFADSANTGHVWKTSAESWVAGDDAAALCEICGPNAEQEYLDLDMRALTPISHWAQLSTDPVERWRFLIAILADIRRQIAAELETAANIKTVFALSPNIAGTTLPQPSGTASEAPTPPFWLIYAVRRFNWPGRLHLKIIENPTTHLDRLAPQDAGAFSRQPGLQFYAGCWEHDDAQESEKGIQPLTVMLEAPTRQASMMAPRRAALPLIEHFQFQDPASDMVSVGSFGATEQRIQLFRSVKTGAENQTIITVTRGEGPAESDEIGFVDFVNAPPNPSATYTLRAELDAWGRLHVSLFDGHGAPVPILWLNTDRDGRKDTYLPTYVVAVDSLLFPSQSDSDVLLRVPTMVNSERSQINFHDVVESLDLTGFDGFPATQAAASLGSERYQMDPERFWQSEMVWLADEIDDESVRQIELSSAALFVEMDKGRLETLSSNFEKSNAKQLNALVEAGHLLPHLQPFDEDNPDSGDGEMAAPGKPLLARFLEALPLLQANPVSPLSAEIAKWTSGDATRKTGV